MPPKKQLKLDKVGLTDARPSDRKTKAGKNSAKIKSLTTKPTPKRKSAAKGQKAKTKTYDANIPVTTAILEAAAGAGIRTTAELQDFTMQTRAQAKKLVTTEPTGTNLGDNSVAIDNPVVQPECSTTPGSSSDGSSSSSDSDSESELDSSDSGPSVHDPVRRKIPFNRETGDFNRVEVSPGSLENGKDTRELNKLQELLLANPDAVNTIGSMLEMMKSLKSGASNDQPEDGPPLEQHNCESGAHRLPPPPSSGLPRDDRPGMSETTIYTQAVPSASPSQIANRNLGFQLDRLEVSGALDTQESNARPLPQSMDQISLPLCTDNVNIDTFISGGSGSGPGGNPDQVQQERSAAKNRTDQMILEAERQKLNLEWPVPGRGLIQRPSNLQELLDNPGSHNLECDNNLHGLSVHLDFLTISKIEMGEFMDLSKLLPSDKVVPDEEPNRLQLVNQDGRLGVAPFTDKDAVAINSFKRWELAFDVYAGVYTQAHPKRGPEILEYKHIIRRAADTYVWQNVYDYDKVHRTHMHKNPGRTWSKKHKDAWSDHVKIYHHLVLNQPAEILAPGKRRKPCRYFNKNGRCTKGSSCEFDHRCSFCGLFGHGRHNCRKLAAN